MYDQTLYIPGESAMVTNVSTFLTSVNSSRYERSNMGYASTLYQNQERFRSFALTSSPVRRDLASMARDDVSAREACACARFGARTATLLAGRFPSKKLPG